LPLIAAILLVPGSRNIDSSFLWLAGAALVLAGEAMRLTSRCVDEISGDIIPK